ncbi:Altronate dehydratase [Verminephrobacter eiseniae EF01-2]|uniref:Altronate dehydratase n=2 Tax=Verminephrobacter eiseniae TaxID=364317 RepID=A1WGB4_VEREI|nr:Altronate dehydratase [Verminephrobacter eiseniae EF01-2]
MGPGRRFRCTNHKEIPTMSVISKETTFLGYRRENGRVGVRNHVVILPLDDLSNAAAEAVAHNIKGALAIPHPYGRLQFGADLDLHFRTLIGAGCNPNVAAVVVIGIEDSWTRKVVDGIASTGKPALGFGIEGHGDHETILRASRAAREFVQWASDKQRQPCAIDELWVSTKCGESDTTSGCGANPTVGNAFDKLYETGNTLLFGETSEITGGEHIVAERCRTPQVRERFMFMFNRYQDMINRHKTSDLSDSQPTKGNIAGGLTTIEEKALGNIQKIGKKCLVDGVLDKAEMPTGPGLWFMDSSSAAAEMVTLCAASGYALHFFPTGQGNVIGNPIVPVIKICANPRTVRLMSEHVDVDTCGLLQRQMTLDQAGDQLLECMLRTACGRLTAAEALGHREFVLTRLYESA